MAGGAYILDYGDSFETSKKDAVIGGVQCVGTEPELTECFHASFGDHNFGRRQTTPNIIISCSGTKHTATVVRSESDCTDDVMGCTDGDVRLQGGTNSSDGHVEFCHARRWVRVCDDEWRFNEARLACGQYNICKFKTMTFI